MFGDVKFTRDTEPRSRCPIQLPTAYFSNIEGKFTLSMCTNQAALIANPTVRYSQIDIESARQIATALFSVTSKEVSGSSW